jgi:hypothetical protein
MSNGFFGSTWPGGPCSCSTEHPAILRVGFTGTRNKPHFDQIVSTYDVLKASRPTEFHHGDCVGADDQAATSACMSLGAVNHVHPGPLSSHPELKAGTFRRIGYPSVEYEPMPYFARNRVIVDSTDVLVANPRTMSEEQGGTWYTVNYARKQGKPIVIVWPDGTVARENHVA